jgi:ubiquinone/menaquinone biosynthesis C-methylase UbiE
MVDVLGRKIGEPGIANVTVLHTDLTHDPLPEVQLDVIFSSMALHHMPDPDTLLQRACSLLRPGGRVCILDLDEEDGSFHGDDASVAHHGFSARRMEGMLLAAGLVDISSEVVREIERTREEDGTIRTYPILMTLGRRP